MNEQLVSNDKTLTEALVVSNQLIRNSTNVKDSSQTSIKASSPPTSNTNSTSPSTSNPVSVCNIKSAIPSKASIEASSPPTSKTNRASQLTTKPPKDVQYDISRSRDVYYRQDSYKPDDAGSIGPQFIPPDYNNQSNTAQFYKLIDLSDFEKIAQDPKFIFYLTHPETEKRKPTSIKASTRSVFTPDENNHHMKERLKFVIGYRYIIWQGNRYHNWFRNDSNKVDVAMFLIKHAKACLKKNRYIYHTKLSSFSLCSKSHESTSPT